MAPSTVWLEIAESDDADEPDALPANRAGLFCDIGGNLFYRAYPAFGARYAYESLGVSHHAAMWLLFASLLGSFFKSDISAALPHSGIRREPSASIFIKKSRVCENGAALLNLGA